MPQSKKKSPMTLGDIPARLAKLQTSQLLYLILLLCVFIIGYLIARVQFLEKGTSQSTSTSAQPTGTDIGAVPAPDPAVVTQKLTNPHLPLRGNADAKVKVVEFSDFECPFCASFHKDTLPQIIKDYIDTGKISLEYRHYPLSFHPQAKPLAIASECANDQGKFWEMHDKIFTVNSAGGLASATAETYKEWARELGLNTTEFNSCLDEGKHTDVIDSDTTLGGEVGVSGTPTFYINGRQLVGAQPFAAFQTIIDEELK